MCTGLDACEACRKRFLVEVVIRALVGAKIQIFSEQLKTFLGLYENERTAMLERVRVAVDDLEAKAKEQADGLYKKQEAERLAMINRVRKAHAPEIVHEAHVVEREASLSGVEQLIIDEDGEVLVAPARRRAPRAPRKKKIAQANGASPPIDPLDSK